MKTYHYHVSYYKQGQKEDNVGDCIINTPKPVKTAEDIVRLREIIRGDEDATVVILGWQLLRIENVKPEEVATP